MDPQLHAGCAAVQASVYVCCDEDAAIGLQKGKTSTLYWEQGTFSHMVDDLSD